MRNCTNCTSVDNQWIQQCIRSVWQALQPDGHCCSQLTDGPTHCCTWIQTKSINHCTSTSKTLKTTRFCNNTDCCWKHGFYIGLKHTSVTIKNPNPVRTPKGCHTHKPNEWWHSQLLLDSKWWHWGKENNSGAFEDPISITHYHSAFSPSGQINALLANSPFHALSNDETMVADKGCTTSLVNTITPLLNKKPTSNDISM